jgi:ribonuclease Z
VTLKFTFLGTGCPVAHPVRGGPAHIVEAGGATVLIDCGSGVAQKLAAAHISPAAIDALVITHYHSDHLVDFYELVISSWHGGLGRPWRVYAPARALAHMRAIMDAWADERAWRVANEHRDVPAAGLEVELHELKPGGFFDHGGLEVEAMAVDHGPVRPAYGLVFRQGGTKLVFSGDTAPCDAVLEAARDADLLVHEVFVRRELPVMAGRRSAATVAAMTAYHTLSGDVGKIAARAKARALALTHFVPPGCDRDALLVEVRADFAGPVILGEDLLSITLPACTLRWKDFTASF